MKKYVMITKANDGAWYKNEIGNIYEAYEDIDGDFIIVNCMLSKEKPDTYFITKENCVEVPCRIGEEAEFSSLGGTWFKETFLGYDVKNKMCFLTENGWYSKARPIDSKKNEVEKQIEKLEEELKVLKQKLQ